jgi:uncharacterized protein YheU (UPF0270 family)
MLLKKQEKDNVTKAIFSSSNICASTYDRTTKNLTIIFSKGTQYKYPNVSEIDYTRFELADSQGVVFNSHIKKYNFEKLDNVDVSSILTEVTELKEVENKIKIESVTKFMVTAINAVIVYHEATQTVDPALYTKMKSAMGEYENITASAGASVVTD